VRDPVLDELIPEIIKFFDESLVDPLPLSKLYGDLVNHHLSSS